MYLILFEVYHYIFTTSKKVKNGQKYIRIAKEFRNKQTIPPNTKRVLKELINKDIDKMNDDQKVDWQTKITDQITICDKMLYNG